MNINRRSMLAVLASAGFMPQFGDTAYAKDHAVEKIDLGNKRPFSKKGLHDYAKEKSKQDYIESDTVPQDWTDLTYDQYRNINFNSDSALWKDNASFDAEFFAPGLYFSSPVKISIVENDVSQQVLFSRDVFEYGELVPELSNAPSLGYSGFRLRNPINTPDRKEEFVLFQGASYFRAVAKDQFYGISARGLAVNTADASGEEFPSFREFWIEKPEADAEAVLVHALLDSPSVVGIYSFLITPGKNTEMKVECTLFPRQELSHVGIAAETSMFLFNESDRSRFNDFRRAVHDSEGLLIENGAEEILWRALTNPVELQISSFVDDNPRGFGLMQRSRDLEDYSDLEANYHKRPGLWVIPGESWGKGAVTLVEIPADKEIYDNIVAYWRPQAPLTPGNEHTFSYTLVWCDEAPIAKDVAPIVDSRLGKRVFEEGRLAYVDFAPNSALPDKLEDITIHVSSNVGSVSDGVLQRNPKTGGLRLSFTFFPGDEKLMELRAQLLVDEANVSEVWLYRWTTA